MLTWLKLPTFSTFSSHFKRSTFSPTRAIFVWPWNENARTKQEQKPNGNRVIWLVYGTDTNARGFWLVKRTLGWKKLHARELSRNQSTLRFDVILQHNWPIERCLLHVKVFFGGKTKSFHSRQITNTYQTIFQGHTKIALSATCSVYKTLYSNLPFLPRWAGISRRSVSLCVDITSEYFPRVDYVPN